MAGGARHLAERLHSLACADNYHLHGGAQKIITVEDAGHVQILVWRLAAEQIDDCLGALPVIVLAGEEI